MQLFKDILLIWFLIDAFMLCVSSKYREYRVKWLNREEKNCKCKCKSEAAGSKFNDEIFTKVIKSIDEIAIDLIADLKPISRKNANKTYLRYMGDLRKIINAHLDYKEKEVEELRKGFYSPKCNQHK